MDQTVHLFPQQASSCRNGGTGDSSVSFQLGNQIKGERLHAEPSPERAAVSLSPCVRQRDRLCEWRGAREESSSVASRVDPWRNSSPSSYLNGSEKIMATLLYGAGLRLMECCRLRVKDIDFSQNQIVVRAGKGDKDR